MVANFAAGGVAINALAAAAGADVVVVDAGVATILPESADPAASSHGRTAGRLVRARVRDGTADMTEGPAMTRADALRAIASTAERINSVTSKLGILRGKLELSPVDLDLNQLVVP